MIYQFSYKLRVLFLASLISLGCSSTDDSQVSQSTSQSNTNEEDSPVEETVNYAPIDFSNWKLTLPVDVNNNGSPDEYQPESLINFSYQTLEAVQPYMYDDITDTSLVFYTYPGISTTNSSYSRTELRELINPANARENWSLAEGGEMIGRLKVNAISEDTESSNNYHNVIVMQIHGILSEEDMDTHNFSSNNGPPLLKMYWKNGYLWAHKKSLIDESTSGDDLLDVSSGTWYDIKHNFGYVGFDAFNFRITASDGQLELQLNDEEPFIYEDISLAKWPFENYFKAGNYLNSTHPDAFAEIKYYSLKVTH